MGRQSRRKREQRNEPAKDPIRIVVGIDVELGRRSGLSNDQIRRRVLDHAKEAVEGGKQENKTMVIDGREETLITPATGYRLALIKAGVDWPNCDLHQQEVLFSRVEKAVTESLTG